MKFPRTARVYVLGVMLLFALTICSRSFADRGGPQFMASLSAAAIVYLLAIREFFASPKFPRRVIVAGLILAAIWHIEFVRLKPSPDDDIHRYVWDGRLQRLGYNPYLVIPSDPAVQHLHTAETRTLNNPTLPSPYPPGAQVFFRAITAIHESTFALKVAFVLCDFAIALLLLDALRLGGKAEHLVLVYAWNPLLPIEAAGSGHIDIVGALLLVVSAVALLRRWRATAAVALGLSIAVKFLPIVLLPLYWKRIRLRDAALGAAVIGALYLPFLHHGRIPLGSLGTYVQTFQFNSPVFELLNRLVPAQFLAGIAVVVGLGAAAWLRKRSGTFRWNFLAWPMAASLLCAPAVFPWYLLWLLPFLTSTSTLLIIVWTVSIVPVYVQWHLSAVQRSWGALPVWVMLVEYGCLAMAGVLVLWFHNIRRAGPRSTTSQTN